ncbi:MAG TPA: cyclopropane fatty acyl phospholipid synthase [Caulobacteraceae bacterium]|nr:cyclopropane fatty acyl phospholipid synthase [Caulobacteraceae bacterium]
MPAAPCQSFIETLLGEADVVVGGSRPWDIAVHDPRFYKRVVAGGSMGLGESYMDGWWDSPALDQTFERVLSAGLRDRLKVSPAMLIDVLAARLANLPYELPGLRPFLARFRSHEAVAETHYETGNDFYENILCDRMIYSCGFWETATNFADAGVAKLDLACRKLGLRPGQRILDIGCGWGAFAKYAAETYGVSVVGVTISEEQRKLGVERCAGLPVDLRRMDYRDLGAERFGRFDHVTSFAMFEHVGRDNFEAYFHIAREHLADGGLFLLETMGENVSGTVCNPWFQKYIFQGPTSVFPSIREIAAATEGRFVMEDWHNFGADYAPTLRAWHANLAAHRDQIVERHGERFYRMWVFYLLSGAGAFASRGFQMWQVVFAKRGVAGGYRRDRADIATSASPALAA